MARRAKGGRSKAKGYIQRGRGQGDRSTGEKWATFETAGQVQSQDLLLKPRATNGRATPVQMNQAATVALTSPSPSGHASAVELAPAAAAVDSFVACEPLMKPSGIAVVFSGTEGPTTSPCRCVFRPCASVNSKKLREEGQGG